MSVDPTSFMGFGVDRLKEQAKYEEKKEKQEYEKLKAEEKRTTNGLPKELAARLAELEKKYGDAPTDMFKLHQQGVQTNDPLSRFSSIFGKGFAGFNKGAPLE